MTFHRLACVIAVLLAGAAAIPIASASSATSDCPCLENGGQPGPGHCACDVAQCFDACAATLCPNTQQCMLACSSRCACNPNEELGCATHVDPGPTPTARPATRCAGDCDGDALVGIDELVRAVRVSLGSEILSACRAGDADGNGTIEVSELIQAVDRALQGCRR